MVDPAELNEVINFLEKHTQYWKSSFVKKLAADLEDAERSLALSYEERELLEKMAASRWEKLELAKSWLKAEDDFHAEKVVVRMAKAAFRKAVTGDQN